MHAKEFMSAVAAFGLISGAAALGCKDDPVEVKSQADATVAGNCKSIDHDLIIDVDTDKAITFGSILKEVKGNFIVKDNKLIQTLDTQSLETIGGDFVLSNLISLVTLNLPNLESVGAIKWNTLNALDQPTFGTTGITTAKSVTIADTTIPSLDGINVQNVVDMDINNNRQLAKFSSSIKTLSNAMSVTANALNMSMELPNLEWIANMTINNVSTFAVPSLKAVNGSMRFNSNYFSDFLAPNLTMIQEGDLSFVNNPELQNISLPLLKTIGGGLTIANNTGLGDIDGLDSLDRVGGAILLRGSFDSFELPKLRKVVGAADVRSTQDITKSCDKLAEIEGQVIQGGIKFCKGNDTKANDATSSDGADGSDGSSKGDDDKSAASLAGASMSTVVTLAALGGLIAAFL